MRKITAARVLVAAVLLGGLSVAGVSTAASNDSGGDSQYGDVSYITPIDRFFGNSDVAAEANRQTVATELHMAGENAVSACMRERGFDYTATPPAPVADFSRESEAFLSMSERERQVAVGYGHAAFLPPNDGAEYYNGREGTPRDFALNECRDQATETIYSEFNAVWDEVDRLRTEVYARVSRDPSMAAARSAWVACMAAAGMPFETPMAIDAHFSLKASRIDSPESYEAVAREELAVARQDAKCQAEFVDAIFIPLIEAMELDLIAQNSALFTRARSLAQGSK